MCSARRRHFGTIGVGARGEEVKIGLERESMAGVSVMGSTQKVQNLELQGNLQSAERIRVGTKLVQHSKGR